MNDIDVLLEWNAIAQGQTIALRPTAHGQGRGIAMVQGAVYDAVNAIDRGHQPYLLDVDALDINPAASYDAAIATAAHHVLIDQVSASQVPVLNAAYAQTLLTVPDGEPKAEGVAAGEAAAAAMLAARANDGFLDPFTFTFGTEPGDWRPVTPTALDPDAWVGGLEPFLIESTSQFRSRGPNRLSSGIYAKDFNEVKEIGSLTSTTRTADQTQAAIFWQFPPTALWNRMFRDLSQAEQLDVVDGSRLFAAVNLAASDGLTACWDDKYYWNFWRPMAAIREADTDGNRKTTADPDWKPLFDPAAPTTPPLTTPPFPDHPSGHGCVSGAVLHTAKHFFGRDKMEFDVHSGRFPGQPRHFTRFSDALEEVVDARVWGGIHFRTADVQGGLIGKQTANWIHAHHFKPVK
ncbi:vanadium-dependent haloperoxidase [Ornithinimicrobium cryptoxanthini]|uniref:Vanadium-dependent haloperoxidase n=1 Tax=Ornithinimicrobium cryptoxanthini TaxID=2934161 RepID=A0ABY4YI37_9MICO|nr:vanadium-dependent haloperoxidase [Ornithinimicrobium cryptoxanthini]USQ76008.1 vanadium-dependent haloperoxidase [Ornithinimicrobium cryptoxanthini]